MNNLSEEIKSISHKVNYLLLMPFVKIIIIKGQRRNYEKR